MNLFDVKDKIIVVTGGLGQLGRRYSLALLDNKAKVAVLDKRIDTNLIERAFPGQHQNPNLLCLAADVVKKDSIETALTEITRVWGTPNALINNAALDSPPNAPGEENGPFETYPESSWDQVMTVNVKGVFLCCQVIGAAMAAAGRGSIVNISSVYGLVSPDQRVYGYRRRQGKPFFKPIAYSASKSALINITRYLATYWAEANVRVNTLTLSGVFNNQDEEFLKNYSKKVPLGRMAREDEYNGAIIFLISEASSYMTGSNLVIDGGFTTW